MAYFRNCSTEQEVGQFCAICEGDLHPSPRNAPLSQRGQAQQLSGQTDGLWGWSKEWYNEGSHER